MHRNIIHIKSHFVNFQITRKYNLICMHCSFDAGKERHQELTFDEIIEIINELYLLNCKKIQITGGEPLLREDVFKIINYISLLGIDTQLLSNGFGAIDSLLNNPYCTYKENNNK